MAESKGVLFRDDFNTLDNWRPFLLPNKDRCTDYTIEKKGSESYLKAASSASASAIIWKKSFNVYDYPMIRWRWKIMNVYKKGDMTTKQGDDYPMRVYVLFEFKADQAAFYDKVKYDMLKQYYGEYPPQAALCYIWANREEETGRTATSVFQTQTKLIALKGGNKNVGKWIEERVNIVSDFQKVFGVKPPPIATIGIMNDSDNTGEQSVSFLDFIEVYR